MKIVIEIPEDFYAKVKDNYVHDIGDVVQIPIECIANGTLLPKGHGKIIDVDSVLKRFEPKEKFKYWRTDLSGLKNVLNDAPAIIEADKEVEE